MAKPGHHEWVNERCVKCGIHITKAKSLVWGCSKAEERRRSGKPPNKRKSLSP